MKQIEEKYIHAKVYEKNKFELKFSSVHVTVCGLLLKKENAWRIIYVCSRTICLQHSILIDPCDICRHAYHKENDPPILSYV